MIDEESDSQSSEDTLNSDLMVGQGRSRGRRQADQDRFQYLAGAEEGSGDEGGQFLSYGDYYTDETFVDQEEGNLELKASYFFLGWGGEGFISLQVGSEKMIEKGLILIIHNLCDRILTSLVTQKTVFWTI